MKSQDSISINADRKRVFAVFCDLDKAAANVSAITRIEVLTGPSQLNLGTKWRETRTMFGKEATEEMWVTGYEQDVSYVAEAESRGTHYRSEYRFTPEGNGTRVDMTFEGTPLTVGARLAGILGALFAGAARKALHQDLVDLKRACETA
ncbi:SRPBCC family protein [Mycetocola miduiensis]|uniref:Polyketide cyclase / dehydrase and lipid transport n=1 Tax=Mycetocola miduiensis TaxID=995034 RepID=A0A1I5DDR5_9MICO|nr:SRPBCC family protein [Mycetocola miduiensis]SFN97408.1 Polyketide cyclase / dehydrase and lipid transport [Mycetocola miduiensis]